MSELPPPPRELPRDWFSRDAVIVARDLLGKTIRFNECRGKIVETEAYAADAASHGRVLTERSRLMRETHGHWYIYFTYGMHYCANVTTNEGGVGAVLIRAVEPLGGVERMKERRKNDTVRSLCSGPAKFCQAFGITKRENGLLIGGSFTVYDATPVPDADVIAGPRIGITRDTELPWRFLMRGSTFVSR